MMAYRRTYMALSTAVLFGTAACRDSTGTGTGMVNVRLTNGAVPDALVGQVAAAMTEAPLPEGSVKSVDVFVVRVEARRQEPSDAEAAVNTEEFDAAQGGWVTIAEPNTAFDLMMLAGGTTTTLGVAELATGAYRGFRLVIDPAKSSVTLNDEANTVISGESIEGLKFPSAATSGIKIHLTGAPLDVEDGETSILVVKFDVTRSFVMRGTTLDQSGLLFTPVIRATQQ